ncbi:DoxX family protein [Leptolyngbya sp. FACHB-16]|nr:DoxX family protein [Leptolyngbya sp. FACHB-8]MBD2158428.1 DoxX family protein [Leptolyngbya sp. FACHB-16]
MNPLLGNYSPYIYAILRIIVGLSFALHGTQKLLGIPGGKPPLPITSFLGFGGLLELICGLLIAVGLFTSYAAFIASGEMAVAYFMMHASKGLLPIVNGGELAVLYCFLFLYIAAHGSGVWSTDTSLRRTRSKSSASFRQDN